MKIEIKIETLKDKFSGEYIAMCVLNSDNASHHRKARGKTEEHALLGIGSMIGYDVYTIFLDEWETLDNDCIEKEENE